MATGRKTVAPGQVVASDWGNTVWDQSVQTFASAADRATQFPAPKAGAVTWLDDVKRIEVFNGTAWADLPGGRYASVTVATQVQAGAGIWFTANQVTLTNVPAGAVITGSATTVAGLGAAGLTQWGYEVGGAPYGPNVTHRHDTANVSYLVTFPLVPYVVPSTSNVTVAVKECGNGVGASANPGSILSVWRIV
jgi:hypothetical protein